MNSFITIRNSGKNTMWRLFLMMLILTLGFSIFSAPAQVSINYGNITYTNPPSFTASNFPDTWDLTKGDLVISYTVDLSAVSQTASWETPYLEVGLREVGASNFNPGIFGSHPGGKGGWMNSLVGDLATNPNLLDIDDKHNLSSSGGVGELAYDATDPNTVVPSFGTYSSRGIWFDRDGVDPWQAADPLNVNGATYNTLGIYDIVISYHAISPTLATMFSTVNGITTGFDTDGGTFNLTIDPAGLSFTGDMTQMQVFTGIYYTGGASGNVTVTDLNVTGYLISPTEVWVDDDWTSQADVDLFNPNLIWQYDAFSTIQDGVGAVQDGGTVHVAAGTYGVVSMHINKPLTIEGADKATTFVEVGAGNIGIYIDADGITLKNFTIQNGSQGVRFEMAGGTIDLPEFNNLCFQNFTSRGIEIHNATTVTNMSVLNCLFDNCNTGIRTASSARLDGLTMTGTTFSNNELGFYNANDGGTSWVRNISVTDCKFLNNAFAGFYVEEIQNATIENSEFTGNRYGFYIFKFYNSGDDVANITLRNLVMSLHTFSTPDFSAAIRIYNTYGINDITVEGCYLFDNENGIRLNDTGQGWSTLHINNNCITNNNLKGVENTSGQAVDATGNWWGDASGPTHASNPGGIGDMVDDNVVFDPWSAVQLPACGGGVLPPYTLLANDDVKLYGMKDSEGDVHANESVEFYTGINKTLTGNVSAVEYVEIAKKNTIIGDVTAGIEVENKGAVTGTITQGVAVAVVPLPAVGPFTAGAQDIKVPKKGALTLPPGDYHEIDVLQQATLTLTSGVYNLKQIEMGQKSRLVIDIVGGAPVTINLVEEIELGKEVKVIINNGASADLAINSTYTSTMTFRDKSVVQGSIIAPAARVVLGKKAAFKGSICADDIEVLKEAYFLAHSSNTPLPKILPGEDEEEGAITALPTVYELSQNYPNPFNPATTIRFALPEAGAVSLKIYNIRGQLVKTLASGHYQAGYHQVQWDAVNEFGDKVASGFYFYSIQAGGFHQVKKMLLIK